MTGQESAGEHGAQLERAVQAFERALSCSTPGGRRHAQPEDDDRLAALRAEVLRQAEALPSALWPRPACAECGGRREVESLRARYPDGPESPQFNPARRRCPACRGTGFDLRAAGADGTPG